jgi:hypothetical protein
MFLTIVNLQGLFDLVGFALKMKLYLQGFKNLAGKLPAIALQITQIPKLCLVQFFF